MVAPGGVASTVRYAGLKNQRDALQGYLASLSAVSPQEYATWSRPQQLAFLVNAYNAYTVELILTRYPDLKSIKDLGSVFESPWKKKFFRLLGQERSLDELEHRADPRAAARSTTRASTSPWCVPRWAARCCATKPSSPTGSTAQLDDALRRFLSDRSRNRFDGASGTLAVSKIFDWYRKDFEQGHRGYDSLQTLFARQAEVLGGTPQAQADLRAGRYKIVYLDYDWSLNDAR